MVYNIIVPLWPYSSTLSRIVGDSPPPWQPWARISMGSSLVRRSGQGLGETCEETSRRHHPPREGERTHDNRPKWETLSDLGFR